MAYASTILISKQHKKRGQNDHVLNSGIYCTSKKQFQPYSGITLPI